MRIFNVESMMEGLSPLEDIKSASVISFVGLYVCDGNLRDYTWYNRMKRPSCNGRYVHRLTLGRLRREENPSCGKERSSIDIELIRSLTRVLV